MSKEFVTLENDRIVVEVMPGRGAKIASIRTPTDGEWLYFDPARGLGTGKNPEVYDDVWVGGFEELFPNDAKTTFAGRSLRDHGELWNSPWEVVFSSRNLVSLQLRCTTVPAVVRKSISLDPSAARFTMAYRLENLDDKPFAYLFKLHPAVRLEPGDRILMPGGRITQVDKSFSAILGGPGPYDWPHVRGRDGRPCDLSLVPDPSSMTQEFVYVSDLPSGWCGLRRGSTGSEFRLEYPLHVFPYCWLFLTYGGWRDYYTAVLEPCTNHPKDLATAVESGTSAILSPGELKEFSIAVTVESARSR